MPNSEKVLGKVKNTVKFKKADGTFSLLTNRLTWHSSSGDAKTFQCVYSDIKVQRISPETSSKVQLQIVLHNDTSYNFHFANPNGRDNQLNDRNQMKDLLAELIPAHRHKANKDLEEKNKIFKERPELYQLYKELVVSGIITADDFWDNQKMNINPSKETEKQEVGIGSGFLAELKPDMHGCNELRFNLTADSIESIFKMYPTVKEKYVNTVPNDMTEKEFWTEFFQSQHFHRDRIQTNASSKDMFGEYAKKDEQEYLKKVTQDFFDPIFDFSSTSPNFEEGYGTTSRSKPSVNDPLIKHFNHQSLMVLQNTQKRSNTERDSDEFKKKRIREALELEDLEEHREGSVATLKILDIDKFAHKPAEGELNGSENGYNRAAYQKNIIQLKESVTAWTPRLSQVLSASDAADVMEEVSPGGKFMAHVGKTNLAETAPSDLLQEMKKQYISLAELLRHFWSCFPVKTPQLEEKVRRMASSLEKYRDTKLANFQCMQPSHCNQLAVHMSEMIEVAIKKFKSWEERRASVKLGRT